MHLNPPLELNERTSVADRRDLIRRFERPQRDDTFAQVIFNGPVDIEIEVRIPTCDLISIPAERLQSLLGGDADEANDRLHHMHTLAQLSDQRIAELKDILHEPLLADCMAYTLFLDRGQCCHTHQLSTTTHKKTYRDIPFPSTDPTIFCWLQILPLVQAFPRQYLPPLDQAAVITHVRVLAKEGTLITEKTTGQSFHIKLLDKGPRDATSYLYGNQTPFDIRCLMQQCRSFLDRHAVHPHSSYRLRYLHFLVYCPKAGLAYMARKLTRLSHKDTTYLWYL